VSKRTIWTGVRYPGRRGGSWSRKEHLCRIEHRYGATKERLWVVALCGAGSGQAGVAWTDERCLRCKAIEARGRR
jgi:hypothetical protein